MRLATIGLQAEAIRVLFIPSGHKRGDALAKRCRVGTNTIEAISMGQSPWLERGPRPRHKARIGPGAEALIRLLDLIKKGDDEDTIRPSSHFSQA
jgi:hypothetical protein